MPKDVIVIPLNMTDETTFIPDPDMVAIILSGMISHTSANIAQLSVDEANSYSQVVGKPFFAEILAADATGLYDIFGTMVSQDRAGWCPILFDNKSTMSFSSAGGDYAYIMIAVWKK